MCHSSFWNIQDCFDASFLMSLISYRNGDITANEHMDYFFFFYKPVKHKLNDFICSNVNDIKCNVSFHKYNVIFLYLARSLFIFDILSSLTFREAHTLLCIVSYIEIRFDKSRIIKRKHLCLENDVSHRVNHVAFIPEQDSDHIFVIESLFCLLPNKPSLNFVMNLCV